jgi:membrane-bound lytic murein transglycosylase D
MMIKRLKILSLMFPLFVACSATNKGNELIVLAEPEEPAPSVQVPEAPVKRLPARIDLNEPKGAAGKISWAEFKSGVQALETGDPLAAMYYFDMALGEVHSEQQADSLASPDSAEYFATMPARIISALERVYPMLINLAEAEHVFSILSDYEGFDSFEEAPLDSVEKKVIENFLDTMNLARFSLPIEINDRVMREIRFLTVNARSFMESSLSRKTTLDSMIFAKLRKRNMPEDLVYLALVESGFKPRAYSKAKAAGVWQFIPATGKRYGLSIDFWRDMRYNPEAATDAALRYLSDLYREFDDWYLAMAAYNCGEGRIRRLVREAKAADSTLKKVSYWDLQLPKETMLYVPRILAATIIGHFPERYSFTVEKRSVLPFDTVTVKDGIPLDKIGSAIGASVNTMRDLNPELTRWSTPPNLKQYTMNIPQGTREKFLAAYEKMDKTQLVRWQQYKVQKGDNLGSIARVFGLKAADIQSANNLQNTRLRVGQVLIIPMPHGASPPGNQRQASTGTRNENTQTTRSESNVRTYLVKNGDNLGTISRRFGVSMQNLKSWNNLEDNRIRAGQQLFLQDPKRAQSTNTQQRDTQTQTHANKAISGASYIVKSGDNLWDIARAHDVTVQQLLDWNPGLDKKIFPGMKIKISD